MGGSVNAGYAMQVRSVTIIRIAADGEEAEPLNNRVQNAR